MVTGSVDVPDVLIDSGATCNQCGTADLGIAKAERDLIRVSQACKKTFCLRWYGTSADPGTFTADIMLAGMDKGSKADSVVVKGNSRTLLGRSLLLIGPLQENSVGGGRLECGIREKYIQALL